MSVPFQLPSCILRLIHYRSSYLILQAGRDMGVMSKAEKVPRSNNSLAIVIHISRV